MAEIKIYGSLKNDTPNGYVAKTADVYDETLGMTQAQINAEGGSGNGFYNLDNEHPLQESNYTLETAVATIVADSSIKAETKNGMIITFWDGGEWKTYRYKLVYNPEEADADTKFADLDNWEEFQSGGGGLDNGHIILQRESPNMITKVGSTVKIRFYYDHVTGIGDEQQSTGNAGQARIIISRAGYQQVLTRTLSAGTHSEIDMTRYMGIGTTVIRLQVIVDTGLIQQSAALSWTISEVQLNLVSDSLSGYTVVEQGTNLEVAYTLESGSADTKAVVCYVDGVQDSQQTIATSVGNGTFSIDTSGLSHGQHTIQLRAQQATGELDEYDQPVLIYSNLLYAVIGVYTEAGVAPLLTMFIDIEDGSTVFGANETLMLNLNQYNTLVFDYGARSQDNITTEVTIKEGNTTLLTATNNRVSASFSTRILTSGSHSYTINAGANAQIALSVVAAAVDLGINVPSGRVMYLDAIEHGHSNTDSTKNQWTNTEPAVGGTPVTTTMTGFNWSSNGWFDGALRINDEARAVVNFNPLSATQSGGMVCGFRYKCTDLTEGHENDVVISCVDTNGTGFYITPQEIGIKQNGTVRTTMKTAENEVYDIAFVVWPASGSSSDIRKNARFIYIYIDGEISGGYRLSQGSSVFQNNSVPISIGSGYATIDVYRTWAYNRALNDSEMLDTYLLDLDRNIEVLLEERDRNAILDSTGNVTPESLPDGTRIMIITGTAVEPSSSTTMASVLAAAKYNDKSTYFPVQEISTYIKGATDRSKNFIARNNGTGQETGKNIPLRIRLQGTSSLAYPVKNYRIYTNKSTMYVGNNPEMPFGETGELATKGLFAMHGDSAPVNVWCLKADYAESSSSHNTGMARMVNDTLKACNIPTPAQRDVDTTDYPYEVRTTVDGEPMVLFYRETLTDTPIFLGKFNFNNDKSTEAVYGFTGIPGYHDVAPLNNVDNTDTEFVAQQYKTATGTDLEVDLTECWEFKNNEDPMGSFLDDDFNSTVTDPDSGETTPKWLGTFEARYPDEDDLNGAFADVSSPIVPHYLSTLVSWVKSTGVLGTDTEEQAAAKKLKFKNELSQYFDVEHLCTYFVMTQMMACLDQMVKNMMMGFWYDKNATTNAAMGKVRAYMIFYDNDTIVGLINNGRLLAPWDVQRDTVQLYDAGGNPVYFYAGHESVLWNNLVTEFSTEIRNAYVKVRSFLTNQKIFEYFDRDQVDKFCQRIYNLDSLNKYVAPTGMDETAVAPYRDLMQGSRTSHRHWFLKNRLSQFDNEWRAGEYYSSANEISFKGISAAYSSLNFTLRQDGNVEVQSDVSDDFVRNYPVLANTNTTITKRTASAVGTIFHVYGVRQMKKLDVSAWDFDQINLGNFPYLEEFVFGSLLKAVPIWSQTGGYLQGNGTSTYISPAITITPDVEIEITFINGSNNAMVMGTYNSTTAKYFLIKGQNGNYTVEVESQTLQSNQGGVKTTVKIKKNKIIIEKDGSVLSQLDITRSSTFSELRLFARSYGGTDVSSFQNAKIYSFIASDNGNVIREMYPAVDGNGVACMYDYATQQFFYNQGTGNFTASQEVIDELQGQNPFKKPTFTGELSIGDRMPRLKKFAAQNLAALPSADLSGCPLIEEIDLSESIKMSSVTIPQGAPLTTYKLPTVGLDPEDLPSGITPFNLSLVGLPSLDEWDDEEETGLNYGVPSKIQSLTFRDCPLIDGFDLLKTIANENNTSLNMVNVTLQSALTGSINDLLPIVALWNNQTGENSNLKVYGSYTVTDASLTTAQCEAIGYDPNGAATQMLSKIYGLMVTIDQSTIIRIVLQSYDPNGEGYNPAVCIILEQASYGSYIDSNDKTKGWYITKSQVDNIVFTGTFRPFRGKRTVVDNNGICGTVGSSYNFNIFDEFENFNGVVYFISQFRDCTLLTSIKLPNNIQSIGQSSFFNCSNLTSIVIPQSVSDIANESFSNCTSLKTMILLNTTPPTLNSSFKSANVVLTHIYVPIESVDIYKNATNWSAFANIIEAIPSN